VQVIRLGERPALMMPYAKQKTMVQKKSLYSLICDKWKIADESAAVSEMF
jgi:hypothetical protein